MSDLTKELSFEKDCQKKLVEGITKLSKAVKSTLGAAGRTVLIESIHHTHGLVSTKDGVTVSKSISLLDPVENLGVSVVKEAAERTATSSGDGTTTSIVLAEALILAGIEHIDESVNKTQVLREMGNAVNEVIENISKDKIDCTPEIMYKVAKTSSNNDDFVANLITEAYQGVGVNGIVTVEKSQGNDTHFEVINGMLINRGYANPEFINNIESEECVFNDVKILVCEAEISSYLQLETIFPFIAQSQSKLLIIAPCTAEFVTVMASNKHKIGVCVIPPPNFGYKVHEQMSDIALVTGATHFSATTQDLSTIQPQHLGYAKKVIVGKKRTVIIQGNGDKSTIEQTANALKASLTERKLKHEIDYINERIASLVGGVGVIHVGGNTDLEQKELFDRCEDAVGAVRSALEQGVIAGSGKPLFEVELLESKTKEREIANKIVLKAIKEPLTQILRNADLTVDEVYNNHVLKQGKGFGYDLKNDQYGDLIEMGVIDPLKVTKNALLNALSVATTILSTNTTIVIARA